MRNSRLLAPDEQLLYELRPHGSVLLRPVLVLLLLSPTTGYVWGSVTGSPGAGPARVLLVLLVLGVAFRWVLLPFAQWWSTVYVLTDQRLLVRQGVRSRTGQDVPLARVVSSRPSSGIVQRLLGAGTLEVDRSDDATVVLADVPEVERIHAVLSQMVSSHQDRRARTWQSNSPAGPRPTLHGGAAGRTGYEDQAAPLRERNALTRRFALQAPARSSNHPTTSAQRATAVMRHRRLPADEVPFDDLLSEDPDFAERDPANTDGLTP